MNVAKNLMIMRMMPQKDVEDFERLEEELLDFDLVLLSRVHVSKQERMRRMIRMVFLLCFNIS